MICRKHVSGFWWPPLVVMAGLGCAQMPHQPPGELPATRAPIDPSLRSGTATQGNSNRSSPPTLTQTAAATPQPSSGEDPSTKLHTLYREAAERYAQVDSYIVRLVRREQLNGKDKPEEIILFKFRKEPWSVYFKWLGTEGKGREVVYVQGRYENKIHTLLAAGDIPLMPGGKRFAVDPDNPFVLSSSRHPIRQAGIGALIEGFGRQLDESAKGSHGGEVFKYVGPIQRPDLAGPGEGVEQTIAAGTDPRLPRGGRRLWVFDSVMKFPVLIITHDDTGHEVEYYSYDRFEFPVHLDDDDFNPDKLWSPKREATPQK